MSQCDKRQTACRVHTIIGQSLAYWKTPSPFKAGRRHVTSFLLLAVSEDLWSAGWVVQIKEEAREDICYRNICEYQFHLWGIELLYHLTELNFIDLSHNSAQQGDFTENRTGSHLRGSWKNLNGHKNTHFPSLLHIHFDHHFNKDFGEKKIFLLQTGSLQLWQAMGRGRKRNKNLKN